MSFLFPDNQNVPEFLEISEHFRRLCQNMVYALEGLSCSSKLVQSLVRRYHLLLAPVLLGACA